MESFIYRGRSTLDFNVLTSAESTWAKPAPVVDRRKVPGRNGDLLFYTGAYENVDITYRCGIHLQFREQYTNFVNFLLADTGYSRLEDSRHPDVYRMAAVSRITSPSLSQYIRNGEFNVTFTCKPQTYLYEGDRQRVFNESGWLANPSGYPAKPLIRVYGSGVFHIGSAEVTITGQHEYVDLDCEEEDANCGAVNCNRDVHLSEDHFPILPAGETTIGLGAGIEHLIITPRWWQL